MPINKGQDCSTIWPMLAMSLTWDGFFPREGIGGNAFDFLQLARKEPEIAKAIEAVYNETEWSQAELYSVTVDKKEYRLVFGGKRRTSNTKMLIYPERIDGALERHILHNALLKKKLGLLRFLWQDEGGWVFFFYPVLGLAVFALGWGGLNGLSPISQAPPFSLWVVGATMGFGACMLATPFAYSWWRRNRLRSAVDTFSLNGIKEKLESLRKYEQGLT